MTWDDRPVGERLEEFNAFFTEPLLTVTAAPSGRNRHTLAWKCHPHARSSPALRLCANLVRTTAVRGGFIPYPEPQGCLPFRPGGLFYGCTTDGQSWVLPPLLSICLAAAPNKTADPGGQQLSKYLFTQRQSLCSDKNAACSGSREGAAAATPVSLKPLLLGCFNLGLCKL